MSDADFYRERIEKTKALIVAYEDAIEFLVTNPTRSYRLDSGQTEQEVTRYDIDKLQKTLDLLQGRLDSYNNRLNSNAVFNIPGW